MLIEQSRTIMATATDVHIAAPPEREAEAHDAIVACFAWLAEVEACLTRFNPESELCRLNAQSGAWYAVSELLFTMVEQSLIAARASEGLFDPGLLPLLEAMGYDRDFAAIAHQEARIEWRVERHAGTTGGWRRIRLDHANRRVRLPRGVRLDFGGIAKGWAADVALDRFFATFENVIISIGGDMRVRGGRGDGGPWPIGVGDPRPIAEQNEVAQAVVTLGCGGLATSGSADRWWYNAGERQHHLIDPRTSRPARIWIDDADSKNDQASAEPLIASVTALAPTAAHAEVAAKVALLRGYPQALRAVESAWEPGREDTPPYGDAGVALLLVLGTGEAVASSNLQAYLDTVGGGGDIWLS
ncbi:MAG: FAD:protein FMN transferase [Ktedonobacterales bacterium]|nr:MAG: FAD:protein FMN transferase [Ktedonobacterales bacterium]